MFVRRVIAVILVFRLVMLVTFMHPFVISHVFLPSWYARFRSRRSGRLIGYIDGLFLDCIGIPHRTEPPFGGVLNILSPVASPAIRLAPHSPGGTGRNDLCYNAMTYRTQRVRPMTTPQTVLKETFGYDTFRPLQREIIENVLARRDTLAVMPTGGGKSLCYQIPALLFDGLTVVVSPLISLMKDQVEQMRAAGVPALFLNSSLQPEEYQANVEKVRAGAVKLLYAAPESLLTPRLLALLCQLHIDCLTIDEAHCISEWGHDFRPEYRQLVDVRRRFPSAVCLALTATATPHVRSDIKASLGFSESNEYVASFNRENLFIEVAPKQHAPNQTISFLERFKDQSGIIYCFSRKQVDDLAGFLAQCGYSVRPYHAGLQDDERRRNQEAFIRDDTQIIVATIAFGMGINKPNVRFT